MTYESDSLARLRKLRRGVRSVIKNSPMPRPMRDLLVRIDEELDMLQVDLEFDLMEIEHRSREEDT